jgi:hypothetical protein
MCFEEVGDGMTTRETVNGKLATVSHLTEEWQPCAPEEAAIVKVEFDDGGVLFGFRKSSHWPPRNEEQCARP